MKNEKIFIKTDTKFKNFRFSINFYTPISKKNATFNQLLLNVLSSGCNKYPSLSHINRRLAELYGSKMATTVKKIENKFCLSIVFDVLCEKYSNNNITSDIFLFAKQIITDPLIENEAFNNEIVEREKNILWHEIEALINNKRRYANMRCMEIVCGDDEYGVNTQGYTDILGTITSQELYQYYKYIISQCFVKIFAIGNTDKEQFSKKATDLITLFGSGEIGKTGLIKAPTSIRNIEENAPISQGKLVVAFIVDGYMPKDEYTAKVFDGVFGGSVVSKLFNNVREKMSLCYYASSAFIKQKGIVLVQSGIDFDNFEKAKNAIYAELEDIKNGIFTDEELINAVSALETAVLSVRDENAYLLSFYENQAGEGEIYSPEEIAEKIKTAANKSKITEFAKKIKLDTVFFLRGNQNE